MGALEKEVIYTIEDIYNLLDGERAELIDGQIYYMSPPSRKHQRVSFYLSRKIADYIDLKNGSCEVYPAPFAVFLNADDKTYVEPDISVICDKNKLTDEGCLGAPDWIIEIISPGTSSHDYVRKLNLYMDAKVREYWIVDPEKRHVVVYHLKKEQFDMTTYTFQDTIPVHIYDDFSIDFKSIEL